MDLKSEILTVVFSLVGDECVPEWAFSGKVGDYTAKAYGITEYIVHLIIPGALLIFFYGRLIYKINSSDSTSATMEKVSVGFYLSESVAYPEIGDGNFNITHSHFID